MKLHEIELFSSNPDTSAKLFSEVLQLKMNVDQLELKVFDSGIGGVDVNISNHYPSNKISLAFLVKDEHVFAETMHRRSIEVSDVYSSHLGLKAVTIAADSICRIVIHSPTEASPDWLQRMV